MFRSHKPDPYNGFKCDIERRRALNVRVVSKTVISMTFLLTNSHLPMEVLRWLNT